MATRFYLPSSGTAAVSPAFDATWDVTTTSPRRPLTYGGSTGLSSPITDTETSASPQDVLSAQFVSAPLAAQTITGTMSLVVPAVESNASTLAYLEVVARVVSNDGQTVRGTLYSGIDGTELAWPAVATRIFSAVSVTSTAVQQGDRIVVEIGGWFNNVTASARSANLRYGDLNTLTDYALTSALTTTVERPWVEFSQTLTPQITVVGAAGNNSGSASNTSVTVTLPAGIADGDLGFLAITGNSGTTVPSVNPPTGWVAASTASISSTTVLTTRLYTRTMMATDSSTVVSPTLSGAARWGAGVVVLRGAMPPLDALNAPAATTADSTTLTVPAVTPVANDCYRLVIAGIRQATSVSAPSTVTPPAGWTEHVDTMGTNTGNPNTGVWIAGIPMAGQAGTAQATTSATLSLTGRHATYSLSVMPMIGTAADTAAGVDAASVLAGTVASDLGSSTDAASLTTSDTAADTSSSVDTATVPASGIVTGTDTSSSTDAATVATSDTATDTSSSTDAATMATSPTAADTSSSVDTATLVATAGSLNRAMDPSLEVGVTGGGSNNAGLYPATGDTSVFYAGARSQRTDRISTLSATISSFLFGQAGAASATRILCAPGEVVSAAARVRVPASNSLPAKSSMQLQFRDASGTTITTVVAGTVVNLTPDTWMEFKKENVTAPALTAYVLATTITVTQSGANCALADKVYFDGFILNTGPTALPYFDGSYPGATWTGTANASSSAMSAAADYTVAVEGATVAVAGTDTSSATDAAAATVAVTAADTSSAADTTSVAVAVTGTDTSSAADTATVTVAVTGTDVGSATNAASVAVTVAGTEVGSSVEVAAATAALTAADTATGVDTGSVFTGSAVTGAEVGTTVDAASVAVAVTGAEVGAAGNAATLTVARTGAETCAAVDGATVAVTVAAAETGTGGDATLLGLTAAEVGAAGNAATLAVARTGADTCAAGNAATVTVALVATELAGAVDLAVLAASVAAAELAAALDSASALTISHTFDVVAGILAARHTVVGTLSSRQLAGSVSGHAVTAQLAPKRDLVTTLSPRHTVVGTVEEP